MVDLEASVLTEAEHRGESLLVEDLVMLVETEHRETAPGVPRSLVKAYVEHLDEETRVGGDRMLATLDENLTNADGWAGDDALYHIGDGRVSAFPPDWHERLAGEERVRRYVEVLGEGIAASDEDTVKRGAGRGVPRILLLDAMAVIGGLNREEVESVVRAARERGDVVADVDQHPNTDFYLPDDAGDLKDSSLDR